MTIAEISTQLSRQMETLPERLGGHIGLSMVALLVGILISVPLGIWASRHPRVETFALLVASIIQTIPGLALLALMVFAWGRIGWLPALIALILYSILPMLRNTITGIHGVNPNLIEAARGVGMSEQQMLMQVQLPLAAPTIVAGIRTAAVWVVGAATIAQPVGATSLGNYIFVGLQTMNFTALFIGCVLSAGLALSIDWMLHGLETAAAKRNRAQGIMMVVGLLALSVSPFVLQSVAKNTRSSLSASGQLAASNGDSQRTYVIGCKSFTEQYILLELIATQLRAAGIDVETKDGMGSATVMSALTSGEIDCYVDYSGTIWANYMKRGNIVSPIETRIDVATYLKDEKNVFSMGPLGFSNDYAFAIRRETAAELRIVTLDDLAKHAEKLRIGGDIEFFDRPEWTNVKSIYGLEFSSIQSMDPTLMYEAIARESVDVIVAFNTEGRLDAYDLVTIEDSRYSLPPYDALLLVTRQMAEDRRVQKALRPLLESISSPLMRKANGIVDVQRKSVEEAATYLREQLARDSPQ